jgi:hypothetical protein
MDVEVPAVVCVTDESLFIVTGVPVSERGIQNDR